MTKIPIKKTSKYFIEAVKAQEKAKHERFKKYFEMLKTKQ